MTKPTRQPSTLRAIWLGITESRCNITSSNMWDRPAYEYTRRLCRWVMGIR